MALDSRLRGGRWRTVALAIAIVGCGHAGKRAPAAPAARAPAPPPAWVTHVEVDGKRICGTGVAGAGFDESSPYPQQLARERAVRNLAGILETSVLEAIIDRATQDGQDIQVARGLELDQHLVQQIDGMADAEYWLDRDAAGPFAQKGFTYARVCVDGEKVAATLKVDPRRLAARPREPSTPGKVPHWMHRAGKQRGGRLCAVGFSLPMFFADNTFEAVVDDVRAQLADVLETLVSQYTEDVATGGRQAVEMITVATTQAVSRGAVVTEFWYDRDGIGPFRQARSTYGWGCVFPVTVLRQGIAEAEKVAPGDAGVAKVKERAEHAFGDLDAAIAAQEAEEQREAGVGSAPATGPRPPSDGGAQPANETPRQPGAEVHARPANETPRQPGAETPAQPANEPSVQPGLDASTRSAIDAGGQPAEGPTAQPARNTGEVPADPGA